MDLKAYSTPMLRAEYADAVAMVARVRSEAATPWLKKPRRELLRWRFETLATALREELIGRGEPVDLTEIEASLASRAELIDFGFDADLDTELHDFCLQWHAERGADFQPGEFPSIKPDSAIAA